MKAIKSVSFNDANPKDAAMMKSFKRKNFSGYVKSLIWEDLKNSGKDPVSGQSAESFNPVPVPGSSRLEQLKNRSSKGPLLTQAKR